MKRNSIFLIFTALFIILCLVPSIGMFFADEAAPMANEVLSSKPQLVKRDGSFNYEVLSDTADYIADRFAFRQELITAWAGINAKLLNTSVEDQVMLGKDGWLFYSETADDCLGIGLSDARISAAANNLSLMNEYLADSGVDFLFAIAPNKGSLYPEMLPDRIDPDLSTSNAARLIPMINASDVNFADLFSAFSGKEVLYYATDSHWTSKGAALGADTILAQLGRSTAYYSGEFTVGQAHRGDLYEMLYPAGTFTESGLDYADGFGYTADGDTNGGNAISIATSCPTGTGTLFCWRDSFGISLYPYLADSFETAFFSRSSQYDLTRPVSEGYSQIIIELVERNLDQLVTVPAVFPAPARDITPSEKGDHVLTAASEGGKTEATSALKRIFGCIPDGLLDAGSKIYVVCGGTPYEATVLFTSDGMTDFSLWVSAEAEPSAVYAFIGGVLTEYPLISQ